MAVKQYIVITKRESEVDRVHELDEARLYQWLKNGSIEDGDLVYEVIGKRSAKKPDMILEDA